MKNNNDESKDFVMWLLQNNSDIFVNGKDDIIVAHKKYIVDKEKEESDARLLKDQIDGLSKKYVLHGVREIEMRKLFTVMQINGDLKDHKDV